MDDSAFSVYSRTSPPPTYTVPEDASYRRAISEMMVDFPEAVGPMMASLPPFGTSKDTSCRTSRSVPG